MGPIFNYCCNVRIGPIFSNCCNVRMGPIFNNCCNVRMGPIFNNCCNVRMGPNLAIAVMLGWVYLTIAVMLGWVLYLTIALITGSRIESEIGKFRFWIKLEKKSFKIFAVSLSFLLFWFLVQVLFFHWI